MYLLVLILVNLGCLCLGFVYFGSLLCLVLGIFIDVWLLWFAGALVDVFFDLIFALCCDVKLVLDLGCLDFALLLI